MSEASETLSGVYQSGVYQFEICDMYMYIYIYERTYLRHNSSVGTY